MKAKICITIFLFALLAPMKSIAQGGPTSTVIENVDPKTFNDALAKKDGILIDLRTPAETDKGFIKGAKMIDYTDKGFEVEFAKLDKNKTTYIYCAGGGRSADAAQYLKDHGFRKVVNLTKGFNDWKKQGMDVEMVKK
jgi:rhodanese-related sulfurtransferase